MLALHRAHSQPTTPRTKTGAAHLRKITAGHERTTTAPRLQASHVLELVRRLCKVAQTWKWIHGKCQRFLSSSLHPQQQQHTIAAHHRIVTVRHERATTAPRLQVRPVELAPHVLELVG